MPPDNRYHKVRTRFGALFEYATADMDEKQYVQDLLVDFGDSAIPLLKKFVAEKEEVVLAVRTLRQLQGDKDVNFDDSNKTSTTFSSWPTTSA